MMVWGGCKGGLCSLTTIDTTCTLSLGLVTILYIPCIQISSQHLDNFLSKIEAGYGRYGNPYHNATHAADVAITTHYFIHSLGLKVRNRTNYSQSTPLKSV